jgi:maleate isomerase
MPEADAVFIGCTGQRLARHIDRMEAKLGKPALTANQVTSWHALRLIGIEPNLENRGCLFRSSKGMATDGGRPSVV